jgi:predicted HicB family RNase H-like nuclease
LTADKKLKSTYRFTPELEQSVTQETKKLGISKNAFVQMTLAKALEIDNSSPMKVISGLQ